jgi:site-specific DNA-methyltransferase (adenine-specific)
MAINIGDQFTRAAAYGRYKALPVREAIIHHLESRGLDAMGTIIWRKAAAGGAAGGGPVMGSFPYPRNGVIKIDYEFILVFRKPGQAPAPSPEARRAARMTAAEWNACFLGHWTFPGARPEEHIAVFPEELPRRLIRMFTFPGETVLDPFLGSGTTLKAAWDIGRAGIGYEIDPELLPVIRRKVAASGQRDLFRPEAELVVHHEQPAGIPAPESSRT